MTYPLMTTYKVGVVHCQVVNNIDLIVQDGSLTYQSPLKHY
jgi:hypothetical protein